MKNFVKNLTLITLALLIEICFLESINAQNTENVAKPSDYEYLVGEKVATALHGDNCSVFVGTIEEINETGVYFSIRERLIDHTVKTNEIIMPPPKLNKGIYLSELLPRLSVEYVKGNELIVFYNEGEQGDRRFRFITSYKELFPSIRKSIKHYISYRERPEALLDVPDLVNTSCDRVFLGYIVQYLATGGAMEYPDYTALTLSKLLENEEIPEARLGFVLISLSGFVKERKYLPIKPETRDAVIKNVVKVGISSKKRAEDAISILNIAVSDGAGADLRPYLTPEIKAALLMNYRSIPRKVSTDDDAKFQRLLETN